MFEGGASVSNTANAEYLRALVETALAECDVELFDLQMGGGTVRVLIDREGGVDLSEVTAATQALTRVLDESDPLPGRYTLEVSSPGIERPLRLPIHFQRAVGEVVRIRTNGDVEGERRVEGELLSAGDDGIEIALTLDGKREKNESEVTIGATRFVAYADIERARTVFDWDKAVATASSDKNSTDQKSSDKKGKA